MRNTKVRGMTRIALMTAVMCVLSQLSLPLGPVPLTLQTFAVALTGALLGWGQGALALCVYLLLGLVGLPVFSGFGAGLGKLMGPTGGFLLGFPVMALLCGLGRGRHPALAVALGLAGLLAVEALGALQFSLVAGVDYWAALGSAVFPFLIKDVVSVVLAQLIAVAVDRRVRPAAA